MNPKQRAAEAAIPLLANGMIVGLGTGSTADFFLIALADALKTGRLRDIRGVPTSRQSEARARQLGIPLVSLADVPPLDITVDGADEIDPQMNLIKGLGGALLREKIVAQNSRKLVIIADASKAVSVLGTKAPLPVEVSPFAHETHAIFLREIGAQPTLRKAANGADFVTDNGNLIYDCRFAGGLAHPMSIESALNDRAGVVESGLFLNLAQLVLMADDTHVEHRMRASQHRTEHRADPRG